MLKRPLHIQQHQHKTGDHGWVGVRVIGLESQRQADDHEEQHGAEGLGDNEDVHRANLDIADAISSGLDSMGIHPVAARPVHAQLLCARGNCGVVALQLIFLVASRFKPLDPCRARDVLHRRADQNRHDHHQEHRYRQVRQVSQAAQGDSAGDGQWSERKGEITDGVDVVSQHRDQFVGTVAFDLLDGR